MTKYKVTTFKSRFQTVGTSTEKTFEEIYLGFKNKVKRTKEKYSCLLYTSPSPRDQA